MKGQPMKRNFGIGVTPSPAALAGIFGKKDKDKTTDETKKPEEKKSKKRGSVGEVLVGALTGGLDAVYGTGKVLPKSYKTKKIGDKEETTTTSDETTKTEDDE